MLPPSFIFEVLTFDLRKRAIQHVLLSRSFTTIVVLCLFWKSLPMIPMNPFYSTRALHRAAVTLSLCFFFAHGRGHKLKEGHFTVSNGAFGPSSTLAVVRLVMNWSPRPAGCSIRENPENIRIRSGGRRFFPCISSTVPSHF